MQRNVEDNKSCEHHLYETVDDCTASQSNPNPEYEEGKIHTPPPYDLPYACVPSSDPGGFASIGIGLVTHYISGQCGSEIQPDADDPVVLGTGSVTQYNTDENENHVEVDENYQPSVVIGDASVVFYQEAGL